MEKTNASDGENVLMRNQIPSLQVIVATGFSAECMQGFNTKYCVKSRFGDVKVGLCDPTTVMSSDRVWQTIIIYAKRGVYFLYKTALKYCVNARRNVANNVLGMRTFVKDIGVS